MNDQEDSLAPTIMPLPPEIDRGYWFQKIDPFIATMTVLLCGLGVVLVYSATAVRAFSEGGDDSVYLTRHLGSVLIGLVGLVVALYVPSQWWSRAAYPLLALAVLMLACVYVPGLGRKANGALRWLSVGPVSFQPAEFAKLAVILYLAQSLAKKREKVSTFSIGFLPHVFVTSGVVALVLAQPDLGTSAVIYATLGVMLFVAGTRISYLVLAVVFALPVAWHYVATRPHAAARLSVFLNPEAYKTDAGYQVWESLVAFGSGGWFGKGLGAGEQKLYFLPEAHTDFVFAVLGQELGFFGAAIALLAMGTIIFRGLHWASRMTCRFPMFLAFGISSWLGLQAMTNMAVALALLPTKGMTLPLLSYGRSSLVITLVALGILLRLTAETRAVLERGRGQEPNRKKRKVFGLQLNILNVGGKRA